MEITKDARNGAYYFKFNEQQCDDKVQTVFMDTDVLIDINDDIKAIRIKKVSSKLGFDIDSLFRTLKQTCEGQMDISVMKHNENIIINIKNGSDNFKEIIESAEWQEAIFSNIDFDNNNRAYGFEIIMDKYRKLRKPSDGKIEKRNVEELKSLKIWNMTVAEVRMIREAGFEPEE
jgi:hypothetical protein